jgi:hypothetical protein
LARNRSVVLRSLRALAESYPDDLSMMDPAVIASAVDVVRSGSQLDTVDLLSSLYAARFRYLGRLEPSEFWQELAQALAAQGNQMKAVEVASRITNVDILIMLKADRRYEHLLEANPFRDDVKSALAHDLQILRELTRLAPRNSLLFNTLVRYLDRAERHEELLVVTGELLDRAARLPRNTTLFDDPTGLAWVSDARARAFWRLGQWDAAIAEMRRGAEFPGYATRNVSQALNLTYFLCQLGRTAELRSAMAKVGTTAPYGALQYNHRRFCLAQLQGDEGGVRRAIAYLQSHQEDGLDVYADALIQSGDLDGAAALFIRRLKDEQLRQQALWELTRFHVGTETEREALARARARALIERPDVRAAIDAVGHVSEYDLRT